MKTIKIEVGTYGYRKNDTSPVELIDKKSRPIEVSDEEAARLISLGIAVDTDGIAEASEKMVAGHIDAKSLKEYSIAELKNLADDLGLKYKARATKDELIQLISDLEVQTSAEDVPETAEDDEVDNEKPPVLTAVDPE